MRGSLIITYLDDINLGGDYLDIEVNGVIQKKIYNYVNGLYTVPLYIGDVVTLTFNPVIQSNVTFSLFRRDYTTDDVMGDNGIKSTTIINGGILGTYTFTVSVGANAYDFDYIYFSEVQSNYQIWTEDDEPIMTENNEYINQEY